MDTARVANSTPRPPDRASDRLSRAAARAAVSALVATSVVSFPAFLLGGLAVFLRRELGFSDTALGALVSLYFTVCALSSVPVGRLVDRFGSRATTVVGITLGAVSLVGMALAPTYPFLMLALAVGGVSNAFGQLGSNQSLAGAVPLGRQGLAFGIKQAAIPAGTLVASAAVPALGQTLGWRWAFGLAGLVALGGLRLVPRVADGRSYHRAQRGQVAVGPLVVIAVGAMLAAGSANALSTFLVDSGVHNGLHPGYVAAIVAVGSTVGIAARTLSGWLADRRTRGHLAVVAVQLLGGAAGLALIGGGGALMLAVGTVVGYGLGWSWPGLLNFAIVQLNPGAAASATSIVQVGVYAGGALGPLGFGYLADSLSYPKAWHVDAVIMCLAAVLVGVGQRLLRPTPRPDWPLHRSHQ